MASGQAKVDIEWGLAEIKKKARLYELYSNYYKGIHRLTFATTEWKNEFGAIFSAFADNLCPSVIGAVRHRLSVIGFASMGGPDDPAAAGVSRPLLRRGRVGGEDDAADRAWAIWNDNRMDRRQKSIYREALLAGDVAVIVWPDDDDQRRPIFHVQKPDKCVVRYSEDNPGDVEYAVKAWITPAKRVRVSVYYRDRVERWISKGAGQTGLPDKADRLMEYEGTPDEPDEFELEVPSSVGRVPVVSFGYDALEGEPGRSRLADVVPLQDALNKSVADMLVAGEFQAIPQRVVIGWTPTEFDANGDPKPPWKSGADRILTLANENAKVAEWAAANLQAFIAEQDSFRSEIARVSFTPLHYLLLSGNFPSGDALHAAEAPLDAVVGDTKDGFGTSHEELMDIALRFAGVGTARLTTLWKDSSAKNSKEQAETVEIKRGLGVSRRQGLRELGYSDPEIDEMDDEEREDRLGADADGTEPTPAPVPGAAGLAAIEGRSTPAPIIAGMATAGG